MTAPELKWNKKRHGKSNIEWKLMYGEKEIASIILKENNVASRCDDISFLDICTFTCDCANEVANEHAKNMMNFISTEVLKLKKY